MDINNKTVVLTASIDDVREGVELGRMMWQESLYRDLPYEPDKVHDLGLQAINSSNYFCRVAKFNNDVNGFMLGYIAEYFFNYEMLATDMALFVKPDKRGSSAAFKLIKSFEQWAVDKGAKEVCLSHTTGVRTKEVNNLYQKLGYNKVGSAFKKRI